MMEDDPTNGLEVEPDEDVPLWGKIIGGILIAVLALGVLLPACIFIIKAAWSLVV